LRGKREKHKKDAQRENKQGSVSGQNLLIGQVGPFETHVLWKDLATEILHDRDGLAGAGSRLSVTGHIRRRVQVIAGDGAGAEALFDGSQRAQGNHLAASVARLKSENIGWGDAELTVRLGSHLKRSAEVGEVVHVGRAEIDLESVKNVGKRHIHAFGFGTVHVHVHLWLVGAKAGIKTHQTRLLIACGDELSSHGFQLVVISTAAVLHHETEAANGAQSWNWWRPKSQDEGLWNLI
jgi:hypothetical protein